MALEHLGINMEVREKTVEKLSGVLRYSYSIRINDQWRIKFRWDEKYNQHNTAVNIIAFRPK